MPRRVRPSRRHVTEPGEEAVSGGPAATRDPSNATSAGTAPASATVDADFVAQNGSRPGKAAGDNGNGSAPAELLSVAAEPARIDQPDDDGFGPALASGASGARSDHDALADAEVALRVPVGYAFAKRLTDIAVSLGLILFLAPLLVTIAVLIKVTSPGPVLFRQERFGKGGKSFLMTKFRTMVVDAPDRLAELAAQAARGEIEAVNGPAFKSKRDPRVTSVGKHLRRFSLDELPQLFDVLSGSMSLVGPRPLVASETAALSEAERVRHLVKPGLTCLWQTSRRSRISYQERLAMDIEYTQRMSFWLDLAVLLRTPLAVFRGDGAF